MTAALPMAACSDAGGSYPDFSKLERTAPLVVVSSFYFDPDSKGSVFGLPFMSQTNRTLGVASFPVDGYLIKFSDLTPEDGIARHIADDLGSQATFYSIVVPEGTFMDDVPVLAPLFGGRVRSHPMTAPRETCRVVSGVRDDILRVGVMAHTIVVETGKIVPTRVDFDREDNSHCGTVALLMLFGFSEDEAQDYMPYVLDERSDEGEVIPDFEAINARAAELSEQGSGWPEWSLIPSADPVDR